MINDAIKATGELTIELFDASGNKKESVHVPNTVVTNGKNYIASRMVGTAQSTFSHMAVGEDNTAATVADTKLGAEIDDGGATQRVTFDSTPSASGAVVTYVATFPAGTGTGAITEAGIFNSGTLDAAGMLCRTAFGTITKTDDDSMTITWTITIN